MRTNTSAFTSMSNSSKTHSPSRTFSRQRISENDDSAVHARPRAAKLAHRLQKFQQSTSSLKRAFGRQHHLYRDKCGLAVKPRGKLRSKTKLVTGNAARHRPGYQDSAATDKNPSHHTFTRSRLKRGVNCLIRCPARRKTINLTLLMTDSTA